MSKRKAGLNNIIYELDNEDIEISSDEEVKEPKINRLETENSIKSPKNDSKIAEMTVDVVEVEKPSEEIVKVSSTPIMQNGGKTSNDFANTEPENVLVRPQNKDEVDYAKKPSTETCKTTILNEDIVIDSPGNSDLGVEGCENRVPLVTVRFKNNRLASNYKEQVKAFMLKLIRLHEGDSLVSNNETDLELDIWPEDLSENVPMPMKEEEEKVDNTLFFVDTDPGDDGGDDVPRYRHVSTVISNIPEKEPTPPPMRRGPSCFNCDGSHQLRDCTIPKDFARIANKRKSLPARVGRYHVEDDQKFGHLIPGRISGQLRHALGLKRHELPLHTYRMRLLGYPPGWLEEARISHSGIAMFDSSGNATLEPEEEEGEVSEPGSKDKFDIKKILDFPGFNVPPSPRYKEEGHNYGLPPMADHDSKLSMLQFLAPNAMKAYKRKKLTMFPSASSNNTTMEGQAEMELDSGDEAVEFPLVPPLPDEAPPAPTPPPPPPSTLPPPLPSPPALPPPESPPSPPKDETDKDSSDDLEVIEVLPVRDIPVPMQDFIVIDEDDSEADTSQVSGKESPSLDDLEAKKQLLLGALDVNTSVNDVTVSDVTATEIETITIDDTIEEVTDIIILNDETEDVSTKNSNEDVTESKGVDKVLDNDVNMEETTDKSESQADAAKVETATVNDSQKPLPSSEIDTHNSASPQDIDSQALQTCSQKTIDGQESVSSSQEITDTQELPSTVETVIDSQESSSQKVSDDLVSSSSSQQLKDTQDSGFSSQQPVSQASGSNSQQITDLQSVCSLQKMSDNPSTVPRTPDSKGHVKGTDYGTPVMNIVSPFVKLPSDDKFAKDICDVINFENLPNSTGKYKQISALLKKVKNEVDRIQES